MDTKLITESDNVKPIAEKKTTGKKDEVIVVPPNPEKDPSRKKEYRKAVEELSLLGVRMPKSEFESLRKGSRFSWIEFIQIHQNMINGKWQSIEDNDRETATLCVFYYDAIKPGYSHSSLYLHADGQLFKPDNVDEVVRIVKLLKIVWLYRHERHLYWSADVKINEIKLEKAKAEKEALKEAKKKEKSKTTVPKNKAPKKPKSTTPKTVTV
jgi:hypothetical protein